MASRRVRLRSPRLVYDIELLRAMADETRQQVLQFLCTPGAGGMRAFSVTEIADNFDLTASTVSHHLQLLRRADLVVVRKDGKERRYSLNWDLLRRTMSQFHDLLGAIDDTMQQAARADDAAGAEDDA